MARRGFDQGDLVMATLRHSRPRIVSEEGSSCGAVVVCGGRCCARRPSACGGGDVLPVPLVVCALGLSPLPLGFLGLLALSLGLLDLPALPRGLLLGLPAQALSLLLGNTLQVS